MKRPAIGFKVIGFKVIGFNVIGFKGIGFKTLVAALTFLLGLALVLKALWIPAKAELAQLLLRHAWEQTQASGEPTRPWPWADHYPVARLISSAQGVEQIVLAGDEGSMLAFAPGENMAARTLPHAARIISGHRDTHFRFLQRVHRGDTFKLENPGSVERYRVADISVVDSREVRIDPTLTPDGLLLVTCYPFDALSAGGPLRYVVSAERIHEKGASGDML